MNSLGTAPISSADRSNKATGRSDSGCATLDGKTCVVGGERLDDYLDSAECYDPLKDEWKERLCPSSMLNNG